SVIGLEDRILRGEVDRIVSSEPVVEGSARELTDRLVEIVHRHRNATSRRGEDILLDYLAIFTNELDRQLAFAGEAEVGGAILVAVGVASDDDRLGPAGNKPWDVPADDRLSKDDAPQNVADRAVRRLPHLLQTELLHARLVGGDRRALHADTDLLDRVGGVDCHLVAGLVAVLNAEIEVEEVHVEIGLDQLVLDRLPDDAGHLVAVELHDRIGDLDLGHDEFSCVWRPEERLKRACGWGLGTVGPTAFERAD